MAKDSEAAQKNDVHIPGIDYDPGQEGPASYSMIEPRLKAIYAQFYKETYYTERKSLDSKTQELIALACSLVAKCDGCIEGHIKKALKEGATKEQISEAIVIAIGVNAAAIVDMTDKAAEKLGLNHFPAKASRKI
ncbi:MAG TPA: carboxymuconolactone decarboxylase family protein [Vicinamibacteria bacterium]|nr:carboxymuconolactone decarboxylase family protein [Vicinamibacteria bacterium]